MLMIMSRWMMVLLLAVVVGFGSTAAAAEYRAVPLEKGPPKEALSPGVLDVLEPTGVAVQRGENRTVCELWFCKKLPVKPGFEPTPQILYPFKEGELVGVIHYPRDGNDFRNQEFASGVFTLRYGLQPADGNHIGTSATRDFLVLLPADFDKSIKPMDPEEVALQSTEVSLTSHPALLALQKAEKGVEKLPFMRHDEDHDWWILQLAGNSPAEGKTGDVRVDLVVVGHAAE